MSNVDIIKSQLANYSAARWDDYKAGLAADALYEEPATMQRAKGVDEYLRTVQRWKQAFPDLKVTVLDAFEAGDQVCAEVELEGTFTGPLQGPFGTISPTNKGGHLRGAMVFTIKDGKIASAHNYFDLLSTFSQLGISPSMLAQAPRPTEAEAQPRH